MTARDLAREALGLAEKATPGEWWWHDSAGDPSVTVDGEEGFTYLNGDDGWPILSVAPAKGAELDRREADAALIAFARTALPALAEKVLWLESAEERLGICADKLADERDRLAERLLELEDENEQLLSLIDRMDRYVPQGDPWRDEEIAALRRDIDVVLLPGKYAAEEQA